MWKSGGSWGEDGRREEGGKKGASNREINPRVISIRRRGPVKLVEKTNPPELPSVISRRKLQ